MVKEKSSHKEHSHDHAAGGHHHGMHAPLKVLVAAIIFTFTFAIIEAIGAWWSGSLALLSDAGHMASDSLALSIAAFAAWVASRPPSAKHTYGFGRAEVLGAWFSSLLMVVVVIAILIEAIERIRHPQIVSGGIVIIIASIGLLANLFIAWILSKGEKTLNVRAAILHVLSDMMGSIAALISGAVIYFKGWNTIDPILSIFICILILFSSLQLLRESLAVLMEGVPPHIELNLVGKAMAGVPQVKSVHDLHIWTLSSGVTVLSAHIQIDHFADWFKILENLQHLLLHDYGIEHVTLQPETHSQVIHSHIPTTKFN